MIFAGFPPTTALSGTSLVTTAPAATTAFSPIADPGVLLDRDLLEIELMMTVLQIVVDRRDFDVGADQYPIFDLDDPRGEEGRPFVDRDVLAEPHPGPVIAIKGGYDGNRGV